MRPLLILCCLSLAACAAAGATARQERVPITKERENVSIPERPQRPQPPPGSERMILNGSKNVRMTGTEPTAVVDFEMVYSPAPARPR
jgi:hypothetical protein